MPATSSRVTAKWSRGRSRATARATLSVSTPRRWSPTPSRSARRSSRSSRSGRVFEGGAVAIGYSTSRDGGATWKPACFPESPTRLRGRGRPSGRATLSSHMTPRTARGSRPPRHLRANELLLLLRQPLPGWADVERARERRDRANGRPRQGVDHLRQLGLEPVSRLLLPLVLPRRLGRDPHDDDDGRRRDLEPTRGELAGSFAGVRLQRRPAARAPDRHRGRRLHSVRRPALRRPQRDPGDPIDGRRRLVLSARACRIPLDSRNSGDADLRARVGRGRRCRPHVRRLGGLPRLGHRAPRAASS